MKNLLTFCLLTVALSLGVSAPVRAQSATVPTEMKIEKAANKSVRKTTRSAYPRTRITVSKRYTGTPGYGFLPGYVPPPKRSIYGPQDTYDYPGTYPWYGWPRNYRGRWNNGGFGPCYTKTPIGPMWNCG